MLNKSTDAIVLEIDVCTVQIMGRQKFSSKCRSIKCARLLYVPARSQKILIGRDIAIIVL